MPRCFVLIAILAATAAGRGQQALTLSGDVRGTHDPAIAAEAGKYFIFATGAVGPGPGGDKTQAPQLPIRCSDDLHAWRRCGEVFAHIPEWVRKLSPKTQELWAPDVSFFSSEFHLYYAFSVFGKKSSGIGLVTNKTLDAASPDYKWIDRGLVLQSRVDDDFNAIDPNVVIDAKGGLWMAFGSFWTGIKMRRLDPVTGLLSRHDRRTYPLASRGKKLEGPRDPNLTPDTEAVEAPFVFEHAAWFYLFVSWDLCCRGTRSTYHEMVGRSRSVTGPYLDKTGRPLRQGGGTEVLGANPTWVGPGGASLLHGNPGPGVPPVDLMVFHAYDARTGAPSLQISTVAWRDGWPEVRLADHPQP